MVIQIMYDEETGRQESLLERIMETELELEELNGNI